MILLDPTARPVIGHRGASAEAPENTLPSFLRAVEQGADAVEFDVHVTADDVPVVIHDDTVARTTSGDGTIIGHTLRRLQEHDAGYRFTADGGATFPYRGRGTRVPTVEEVLDAMPRDLPLIVEVKALPAQWALRRALDRFAASKRCIVASFEVNALQAFMDGQYARAATRREVIELLARTMVGLPPAPPAYQVICPPSAYRGLPVPIGAIARVARRLGAPVHVWTVDEPHLAERLWRDGANGMISNAPRLILEAREG